MAKIKLSTSMLEKKPWLLPFWSQIKIRRKEQIAMTPKEYMAIFLLSNFSIRKRLRKQARSWADSTTNPFVKMPKWNWSSIMVGAKNWKLRIQSRMVKVIMRFLSESYLNRSKTVKELSFEESFWLVLKNYSRYLSCNSLIYSASILKSSFLLIFAITFRSSTAYYAVFLVRRVMGVSLKSMVKQIIAIMVGKR